MQSIQILNLQRGKSPPRCNLQAVFRYPLPRATFYIIRKLKLYQSCASILISQNRELVQNPTLSENLNFIRVAPLFWLLKIESGLEFWVIPKDNHSKHRQFLIINTCKKKLSFKILKIRVYLWFMSIFFKYNKSEIS